MGERGGGCACEITGFRTLCCPVMHLYELSSLRVDKAAHQVSRASLALRCSTVFEAFLVCVSEKRFATSMTSNLGTRTVCLQKMTSPFHPIPRPPPNLTISLHLHFLEMELAWGRYEKTKVRSREGTSDPRPAARSVPTPLKPFRPFATPHALWTKNLVRPRCTVQIATRLPIGTTEGRSEPMLAICNSNARPTVTGNCPDCPMPCLFGSFCLEVPFNSPARQHLKPQPPQLCMRLDFTGDLF